MRIKAIVSYNGNSFYGFQTQNDSSLRTVEDEIEKVLSQILNQKIEIAGSGRTDRGVHALGQVIHFDVDKIDMTIDKLRYSSNRLLPNDIHFEKMEIVDDDFHSRFSAKGKHYRYIINNGERNPMYDNLVYNFERKLDLDLIIKGSKLFLGEHDFENFCSNIEGSSIRTISQFDIKEENGFIYFDIYGNGFRRYMVRMIIGNLIELGLHNITLEDIAYTLSVEKKETTRYNAPSVGLYLVEVFY